MDIKRIGSLLLLAWPVIGFSELSESSEAPHILAALENYSAENGFGRPITLPLTKAAEKTTLTKVETTIKKPQEKTTVKKEPKKYSMFTKRIVNKKTEKKSINGVQRQKQTLARKKPKKTKKPTVQSKAQPKEKNITQITQNQLKAIDPNIVLKQCASYFKASDFSKALITCQKAADQNDSNAQFNLAKMYSTGFSNTAPDYAKAFDYATLAAKQNHAEAQYLLALCYENGIGVKRDSAAAIRNYQQAVKNGLANAAMIEEFNNANIDNLADISWPGTAEYKSAIKDLKNPNTRNEGIETLEKAAQLGHPLAEYQLAKAHLQGDNIAQDDAKAIEWFTKSAQKNYQPAQSHLAWMNFLGLGTKQSNQASVNWFIEARQLTASHDYDSSVQEKLSQLTSSTPLKTQPANAKQRLVEFKRGVELIETSPQAHIDAIRMVSTAAEKDFVPAQLYLANLYATGDKVPADVQKSTDWYLKAAAKGNASAQYALGWHYYHGQGVAKNTDLAMKYFHQASLSGDVRAKNAESFLISQQVAVAPKPAPTTLTLGSRMKEKVNANVKGIFKAVGLDRLSGYEIFNKKS